MPGKHLTAVSHYGGQYSGPTQAVYTIDATAGTIQIGTLQGYVGMTPISTRIRCRPTSSATRARPV
jgi:hypothetical protein